MIREWSKQYGTPFFVGIFAALSSSGFSAPSTPMTATNCKRVATEKFADLTRKPVQSIFELGHERKGDQQLLHLKLLPESGSPEFFEYSLNAKAFDEFMLAHENSLGNEFGETIGREKGFVQMASAILRGTARSIMRKDRTGHRTPITLNPLNSAQARAIVHEIVQDACVYLTTAGKAVEK